MKPTQNNNGGGFPHTPRYKMSPSDVKRTGQVQRDGRLSPSRTVKRTFSEAPSKAVSLREKFNGWRLGISLNADDVIKAVVIAGLLLAFTLLQTTLFARFRPFGVIPDLILPFVIATASLEREKWGSIVALIAAYVIDAAGGTTITLLPLLYVPSAVFVGLLTTYRLRDSFSVAAIYTVITSALRGIISFVIVMITLNGITVADAVADVVIPEFFANVLFALFPQIITRICLRPFHKTRAERTGKV